MNRGGSYSSSSPETLSFLAHSSPLPIIIIGSTCLRLAQTCRKLYLDMQTAELLEKIRPYWLNKISHRLAQVEGVRESFLQQLNRFYELLEQAVESGTRLGLDPLLTEWSQARTQTELDKQDSSFLPALDQIMLLTVDTARENLTESECLQVIYDLLPLFTYSFEFTTRQEIQLHTTHISSELEKANAELQRLDKSKSDFIAVAAHELKTPLTLIKGYTTMMREMLPPEMEALLNFLKGIEAGNVRLREIVDDMIDVSMIDNNMLSLNYQPIWMNRMLDSLRREVVGFLKERNQTMEIADFPGANDMTFGDGERLLQAFRNLFLNAIKYTPDGGHITINGRLLPGFVEVTVTDNGIGIDPDDQLRIFEKFGHLGNAALHSTSKVRYRGGGAGLGLPIAKGILEAHGGAIWVESDGFDEITCPGSTFHVLLPLRKEPPDPKSSRLFKSLMEKQNFS